MLNDLNRAPGIAKLQAFSKGTLRVSGLHPDEHTPSVDPFLGVDHFRANGPTFPPHPHAGFSAITYLFRDSTTPAFNRDSLGNRNLIDPGGLHWTAAGRGVVHEEGPNQAGKEIHGLQIFVSLPKERQHDPPFALHLKVGDVPVHESAGVRVYVPFGKFERLDSGLETPTDVTLLDISVEQGSELPLLIPAGANAFVMPVDGLVSVDGNEFSVDQQRVPVFGARATSRTVRLEAHNGSCHVAVFYGTPLRQPVYWAGGMSMASPEELERAVRAYKRGEFGSL